MFRNRRLVLILSLALPHCSGQVEPPPSRPIRLDLPAWRFSAEPTLSIGVEDGDPNYQFFRVLSAVRLADQTIVVANTGTGHLRFYDPDGRYVARAGGRGGGPGEFRALISVYAVGTDSIMAFDRRFRKSYFDIAGHFIGSINIPPPADDEFPMDHWLYRRNWVEGVPDDERRVALARTLDRLPFPFEAPGYWYIKVDRVGNLWISDGIASTGERTNWTIHDSTGTAIARTSLPPRFEMLEITERDVLGVWLNDVDVEFIRVYALDKPTGVTATEPIATPPVTDRPLPQGDVSLILSEMRSILRNTVTAQEAYFADHTSYVLNRNELDLNLPEGIELDFLTATRRGYLAVVLHAEVSVMCGIGINLATPPGWFEGRPKCSQLTVSRAQ